MKVFDVSFTPMWPVPSGLIIAAESMESATKIAKETIKHTEILSITELDSTKEGVLFYASGDY